MSHEKFSIFLGGTFRTQRDEKKLEKTYSLLSQEGYEVWWAPKQVSRGYGSKDLDLIERINLAETQSIKNSDLFVGVMRRATFGTAFEIYQAHSCGVAIIGYIVRDHPDFLSSSFRYRVRKIVRNDKELLNAISEE